jgi:hypothetical protein
LEKGEAEGGKQVGGFHRGNGLSLVEGVLGRQVA